MRKILIIALVALGSCKNPPKAEDIKAPTPEAIFNTYHDAIVIIRNDYLYKIETENGKTFYWPGIKNGAVSMLYEEYDSAYEYRNVIYGTGFFIDKYGVIATNRHVIEGIADIDNLKERLASKNDSVLEKINTVVKELEDSIKMCEYALEKEENIEVRTYQSTLIVRKATYDEFFKFFLNIYGNLKISVVNCGIGVASDVNYKPEGDLIPCDKLKVSNDKNIDLALIQTTSRQIPLSVSKWISLDYKIDNPFFTSSDSIVDRPLKINTKLYMIGYNKAGAVGITSNGLKPQLTQGTVSQESDETQVLYSIPSLSGSSGSPVFDEWGNIVAINFAGITSSQAFNYGIMIRHLRNLYNR